MENNQNENNENLENSNNQNLREKNRAIFANNSDGNSQIIKQNKKFKLSGWDKFKLLLSFLFVVYGWYYFLNTKTPQNINDLETCVGKMKLDIVVSSKGGIVYNFLVLCDNIKQTKFIPISVNPFYGYIENWLESGKAQYFKNENLLRYKTAKIWYQTERSFLFWHKVNRAYQIQILDFDYEKNPNLKNGEYFTTFTKQNIWFMDYMILFMVHIFFLIITIKILINLKEK